MLLLLELLGSGCELGSTLLLNLRLLFVRLARQGTDRSDSAPGVEEVVAESAIGCQTKGSDSPLVLLDALLCRFSPLHLEAPGSRLLVVLEMLLSSRLISFPLALQSFLLRLGSPSLGSGLSEPMPRLVEVAPCLPLCGQHEGRAGTLALLRPNAGRGGLLIIQLLVCSKSVRFSPAPFLQESRISIQVGTILQLRGGKAPPLAEAMEP